MDKDKTILLPPVVYFQYPQNVINDPDSVNMSYYLNKTETGYDLGPFSYDTSVLKVITLFIHKCLKEFLQKVLSWNIVYRVKQVVPEDSVVESDCYTWKVTQKFNFAQRGIVNVELDYNRYPCQEYEQF